MTVLPGTKVYVESCHLYGNVTNVHSKDNISIVIIDGPLAGKIIGPYKMTELSLVGTDDDIDLGHEVDWMLDHNEERYPNAVNWIRHKIKDIDLRFIKTPEQEMFDKLSNVSENWEGHPFTLESDNFVQLIKWYRNKHKIGLKEAKDICEEFLCKYYPTSTTARRAFSRMTDPLSYYKDS